MTPRVTCDRVAIDIAQGSARPVRGGFVGGNLQTQVTGPLRTWIPLGASEQDRSDSLRSLAAAGNATIKGVSGLELRVTPLD